MNNDPGASDEFALSLLDEAKRFLEKARGESSEDGRTAFLHAGLLLAFCSFEAHINAMSEDFAEGMRDLSTHDKGILTEREVALEDGEFVLRDKFKMIRLEDRVRFICKRFAKKRPVDFSNSSAWWNKLSNAIRLRNDLTHPKSAVLINVKMVESAIEGIIGTLDAIYLGIYGRPFPAVGMQLDSSLTF